MCRASSFKPAARWIRTDGWLHFDVSIPEGTSLYGQGEVTGRLRRNGTSVMCWNTDNYGFSSEAPLYQTFPWVLAVLPTGEAFGLLLDTSYLCQVDLTSPNVVVLSTVSPEPAPLICLGPYDTPLKVVQTLAELTGRTPMPARWTLGHHQSKWSYVPASAVVDVANCIRTKQLPCDAIWLDLDYLDGFKSFRVSPLAFPDFPGLTAFLHERGFKMVGLVDPAVKQDRNFDIFTDGTEKDVWVKNPDGSPYVGAFKPHGTLLERRQ